MFVQFINPIVTSSFIIGLDLATPFSDTNSGPILVRKNQKGIIMKKMALIFIGLLLSQSIVHAQLVGYTQIPAERLDSYKESILLAIAESKINVDSECGNYSVLKGAQTMYLQENSNQPLILAEFKGSERSFTMMYTTDTTFKRITNVQLKFTEYNHSNVNNGDLKNPKIDENSNEKSSIRNCVRN